jgi:hypothetical protein
MKINHGSVRLLNSIEESIGVVIQALLVLSSITVDVGH